MFNIISLKNKAKGYRIINLILFPNHGGFDIDKKPIPTYDFSK
jgi:hypothetical protein